MTSHTARMTSLVLAFGFFFGCTALEILGDGEERARSLQDEDGLSDGPEGDQEQKKPT